MTLIAVPTRVVPAEQLRRDLEALHSGIQVDLKPLRAETYKACDHCTSEDCPAMVYVSWRPSQGPWDTSCASVGVECAWRLLVHDVIGRHTGPIYVQIVGWPR